MGYLLGSRNFNIKEKFLDRVEVEGVIGIMLVYFIEMMKEW